MAKPSWILNLSDDLKKSGKLIRDHTGRVTVVLNMVNGGVTACDLSISEQIK